MVTVEVLKTFYDLRTHENRFAGTTFLATEERAAHIDAVLPGYVALHSGEVEEKPVDKQADEPAEKQDLSKLNVQQLRAMCVERGIAFTRYTKKPQLIALLGE